jgi:hypothetical protein
MSLCSASALTVYSKRRIYPSRQFNGATEKGGVGGGCGGNSAPTLRRRRPLPGEAATCLFVAGMVGVGFLAMPIMTTGAAYDVMQSIGREGSLHDVPSQNKLFYGIIALVTALSGAELSGVQPDESACLVGDRPGCVHLCIRVPVRHGVIGRHLHKWTHT